jgi:hypothetical protein
MKTICLTNTDDDNTTTWYLTEHDDLIDSPDDYPGEIVAKVVTHAWYPGSVDEWRHWILQRVRDSK